MDYTALSKSELWSLVKTREIVGLSWQSSKDDMVSALTENDKNNSVCETVSTVESNDDFSLWGDIISDVVGVDTPDYTNLTKPELWAEMVASDKQIVGVTWDSTKDEMIDALTSTKVPVIDTPISGTPIVSVSNPVDTEVENNSTPTLFFNWHYIDHPMSGGFKQVVDEKEISDIKELIDMINLFLPEHKKINYLKRTVSIKMHPKVIIVEGVNDQKNHRIEKQKKTDNKPDNRQGTKMATSETPGRNVGEAAVKASVVFRPERFLSEPFILKDGQVNVDGIDTISIDKTQVYPCSLVSHLPENHPAYSKLSPKAKSALVNKSEIKDLSSDELGQIKTYRKRQEIAQKKVKTQSFSHIRGKIHNGFSPAFKDIKHVADKDPIRKTYCFELDKTNRVRLWSLADDMNHSVVSANDLVRGRLIQDLGFLEVIEYTQDTWRNLTLDMIKGGTEARLERFNWIADKLNLVELPTEESIYNFLANLTTVNGEPLIIKDLRVNDNLISGELYNSKLLIGKRQTVKHRVVLHPNVKASQKLISVAQMWVFSLPGSLLNGKAVLGLNTISNKTRVSDCTKKVVVDKQVSYDIHGNKHVTPTNRVLHTRSVRPQAVKEDLKYLKRMLTKFSTEGIYAEKEKLNMLGRLVLTDGSELTQKHIDRIAQRVLDRYPVDKKLACLFTPTMFKNPSEYPVILLRLLKTYADVQLGILHCGEITLYDTDINKAFKNWCNGVYRYLASYGKAVSALTLGDAISMLQKSPYSPHKETLLKVPSQAKLNTQLMLKDCTD